MACGDRAAKAAELRNAIDDCVQRKRQALSDGSNAETTLKRAAEYRETAAKFMRQATEAEASVKTWRERLLREDAEIARLRTELEALRKEDALSRAARELEGLDPALLAEAAAAHPEVLLLLAMAKKGGDA